MGLGVLLLGGAAIGQLAAFSVPWPRRYRTLFERYAPLEGAPGSRLVNADLLHAIAWRESNFNPAAVSPANTNGTRDYGLMQINQVNFQALGLSPVTALDPERSVAAAARLLVQLEPKARNVADLFSMYNAGQAAGGGPRLRQAPDPRAGTYVNQEYVQALTARYALVRVASFAPVKQLDLS